jgi:hypothetical protein
MMVPGFMHTYIDWKETWGMPHIGIVVQVNPLRLERAWIWSGLKFARNYCKENNFPGVKLDLLDICGQKFR